jgi:hypothetical protein
MIDTIEILTDRDALWRKDLRGSMKPKEHRHRKGADA